MTTTTIAAQGSVDELGRLVHEDDLAAQLALAFHNLEDELARTGGRLTDLVALRVRARDLDALADVDDVLLDRLAELGVRPVVETVAFGEREVSPPGLLVTVEALVAPTTPHPSLPHPNEGRTMSSSTTTTTTTAPASPGGAPAPGDVSSPAEALRGLIGGRVVLPGDPAYDAARTPWNLAVDQRPAAVAVPRTPGEVAEVVAAATAAGLRVAPQSSGHGAAALAEGGLGDVVLVRLHELTGVTVDPEARTARVLGGTLWADVAHAAAQHGLAALHGSSPDVSVAGYTLGGGVSFYARQHGLAAHSLVAAEVVTADGALVRADTTRNTDLLWALRGGGGNLGVVVALELALLPIPDVYAGMLLFDRERAPEVVRAWTTWTRSAPESATTSLRVMSFPPLPELQPFLSGRQLVVIDGAVLEDDARAEEVLAPLRALHPEMDTFGRIPAPALLGVHMDPPGPVPAVSTHAMLGDLDEDALAAFLAQVGPGTESALMFAELRHLGGALARPADGALTHLDGDYALFCLAPAPFPEAAEAGLAAGAQVVAAMARWSTGGQLLNFAEQQVDARAAYGTASYDRLRKVLAEVDPDGRVVANHRVR